MQSSMHHNRYQQEPSRSAHSHRRSKYYHPLHNQLCHLARIRSSHSARDINDGSRKPDDSFEDAVNDSDGINFVSFLKYARVRDTSFYARNVVHHKILSRSAYFPEEENEEKTEEVTECARSEDYGSTATFALPETEESFASLTLASDPITTQSRNSDDLMIDNVTRCVSSSHMPMKSHETSINNDPSTQYATPDSETLHNLGVHRMDKNESSSIYSHKSSLEEINGLSKARDDIMNPSIVGANNNKITRIVKPDPRRMMIETESLSMLVRAKLMVSRRSKFVIWLKDVDLDLARIIALHPSQFVLCVESLNFIGTPGVMPIFQSIGMMFMALNMLDITNHGFKLVWILSFAHKPFTAATSEQFFNSVDELGNVVAKHFEVGRSDDCINIIRTFSKPCHRGN